MQTLARLPALVEIFCVFDPELCINLSGGLVYTYVSVGLSRDVTSRFSGGGLKGSSFEAFYERHFDEQVRRATLILGSSAAAHDVVQDAFVRLYLKWAVVELPERYLGRSVVNACRDSQRRRVVADRALPKLASRGDNPSAEILDDILATLPFNHRAAIVLRFYCGMSTAQIAEYLECRPGSVGPWIGRGLSSMRKALR